MVAQSEATRSVITLGVSTERGAVHAVALDDSSVKLSDRVLLHRVVCIHGDSKAELAAAVARVMDEVADEIGSPDQIAGAAVAYRDTAERRGIVTRLAAGPWHSASLVSTKSAHLSVAGAMTWLNEFDHLLICEVVPGYQAFTLVDAARSRVLAATGQPAAVPTMAAMSAAVAAARDQLDAAEVRPDAVVLIGSGADQPAVMGAVSGFGAPVIPCRIAGSAPAVGAALFAMADLEDVAVPAEPERSGRGSVVWVTAAGVLAGGMTGSGVYVLADGQPQADSLAADPATTAASRTLEHTGWQNGENPEAADTSAPLRFEPDPATTIPETVSLYPSRDPQHTGPQWAFPANPGLPLLAADPETRDTAGGSTQTSVIPAPAVKLEAPNGLLFPGEEPPPPAFTPESYAWWDKHLRLLVQWAAQQVLPEAEQPEVETLEVELSEAESPEIES